MSVRVECRTVNGDTQSYRALTQNVSADGALLLLDAPVSPGQPLTLINEATSESVDCFVTAVREKRDNKGKSYCLVGVGFPPTQASFWHIVFPKAGTRQATRAIRTGALSSE